MSPWLTVAMTSPRDALELFAMHSIAALQREDLTRGGRFSWCDLWRSVPAANGMLKDPAAVDGTRQEELETDKSIIIEVV